MIFRAGPAPAGEYPSNITMDMDAIAFFVVIGTLL